MGRSALSLIRKHEGGAVSEPETGSRQTHALHVVALAAGGLLAFLGAILIALGILLSFLYVVERDDDGFLTTPRERIVSTTHALTAEEIDLGSDLEPDNPIWDLDLATIRVSGSSGSGDAPVFIGIGREQDVDRYLSGVVHEEIEDVEFDPFEYETTFRQGQRTPAPPGEQTFWEVQASGGGEQVLEWEVEQGRWALVLMNADGSLGVDQRVEVGVKTKLLLTGTLVLLGLGTVLLLASLALVVFGVRGLGAPSRDTAAPRTSALEEGPYPARLEGTLDKGLSRGLWLVKWLLAIPHFLILIVLWVAFWVVTVIAFFAILFTGRYPRGLFDFNVGVMRWTWRVAFYATSAIGTDEYPPFTLQKADYPADFDVAYPDRLSRGLVLIKWWLLAIPHYLVLGVVGGGLQWPAVWSVGSIPDSPQGPFWGGPTSLVFVLVIIAGAALLFTGRYPRGIFDFVMGLNRWVFRVQAYVSLMTDEYPPFRLDQGPRESRDHNSELRGAE